MAKNKQQLAVLEVKKPTRSSAKDRRYLAKVTTGSATRVLDLAEMSAGVRAQLAPLTFKMSPSV